MITLGLDLGSYSLKAVAFEPLGRGTRRVTFNEVRRPEGDRSESLKTALAELLATPGLAAEGTVVALPGSSLALHAVTLPFIDPKRIEAALPFELESQLPFELSEAVYDYQRVGGGEAKSQLLAGVVRKAELADCLRLLADAGVDPRVVAHPALAFHNLFAFAPQIFGESAREQAIAVLDIGHERTCVAVGRPVMGVEWARTFAGGGKDLTRSLATEFQTDLDQAARWKETHASLAEAASGSDAERAAGALLRGLQNVLRETRATLKGYSAATHGEVTRIYLSGGTARLPGLAERLTQDLGLPTQNLSLPQELEAVIPTRQQPTAGQAYALALRGTATGSRAPRFNLRRGEFVFRRDSDSIRDQLVRLGAYAAALVVLFLIFTISRSTLLSRREREVDRQLCAVTERVLGRCEPNYDKALNLLRGQESPAGAIPKQSAVTLLNELNEHVPQDLSVKFDQVVIDLDRLQLRGETDSPRQVDTLSKALKGSPCFQEIKEGRVEKTRDAQHVSFRLDVQVQCPGQETAGVQ